MSLLKKFTPPDTYINCFLNVPPLPYTYSKSLNKLLRECTFYIMNSSSNMSAITFHKDYILLEKEFESLSLRTQTGLVAHELIHVIQQDLWGWWSFMFKYIKEWIKAGFSYEKMTTFGIEKVAYDYQKLFLASLSV
jgi:hypothetical protein